MKKSAIIIVICLILALAVYLALPEPPGTPAPGPGQTDGATPVVDASPVPDDAAPDSNDSPFAALLGDLVNAYENPSDGDEAIIAEDLEAVMAREPENYELAKAVADHWTEVFLDPEYRLYIWTGGTTAEELKDAGIPEGKTHAIVVLGYQLSEGRMQPELEGRCEAAAAMARSYPQAILVCSGGATGEDNPEENTEAGLMKEYLTRRCGIDPERIFIDEEAMTTAENAENTFRILRQQGIETMTIVTSTYHQRWGQEVYNAMAALCRRDFGYSARIVGNYCYDIEPSEPIYVRGDRIAAAQIAQILGIPYRPAGLGSDRAEESAEPAA